MSIYSYRVAARILDGTELPGTIMVALDHLSELDANALVNFIANEVSRAEGFAYTVGYGSGYRQAKFDTAGAILSLIQGRHQIEDDEFLNNLEAYLLRVIKDDDVEV